MARYASRTLREKVHFIWVLAVFFSAAESSVSNEVKDFQPVSHSCKITVGHVICGLACSESPSLKGSHWGEDFTRALSVLCTVDVKLPVESMQLYFVVRNCLKHKTIGLWLWVKQCPFPPHYQKIRVWLLLVKMACQIARLLQTANTLSGSWIKVLTGTQMVILEIY